MPHSRRSLRRFFARLQLEPTFLLCDVRVPDHGDLLVHVEPGLFDVPSIVTQVEIELAGRVLADHQAFGAHDGADAVKPLGLDLVPDAQVTDGLLRLLEPVVSPCS
jgi:hypothetical protein